MNVTRPSSRLALVGGAALSSVLLLSPAAHAHVTVQPQGEAAKGGYATVNFKVPNERDGASTVKLEVTLDRDHPLASVMPQPVPGWTVKVEKTRLATPLDLHGKKITEAPSKITWTASGSKIEPGQFQQFPVSLGRLPENTDRLVFKALQTYDNKEVVRWIEEPRGTEPDSPAPVLELTSAEDGETGGETDGEAETAAASTDTSDTTARVLGAVGILVGAVGIAYGALARRRSA
ncbi:MULTISPECIES: YcnI family protein [Streptomyces]|uniref:YcnI family protein n=1 Tax=Streptomyces sudanensis TaxID=436397 RepID=A0ABY4TDA6_9ACTN|nr:MULTISPECIES: YcnI family protein [Streptomyces]MCP9958159.1 YcnI family protein [Streptomyces sudanensis]MCP9987282.1 YcnI family protein [Streptomyces sudanensis]MCQ0001320.1 YcnI family protein [Streptomyces sudanensis]URN16920.1 YcnI family protein [Streptomyces sudanensis]